MLALTRSGAAASLPLVQPLPIDPLLPDIIAALRDGSRLVLRAPPGAGKTTRVPAALLDAGVAGGGQVFVLEPRRIAARAAAEFIAAQRGAAVGGEVGYQVRFEQCGDADTRLWFVTEGVLGRQFAHDAFLEDIAVVVLDEFHERHLPGDLALAIVRQLQTTVRPDLKLLVMSATLDTDALADYLDDAPVLTSEGRAFPVRVEHAPGESAEALPVRIIGALRALLAAADDDGGDILVFLPGAAEIRRVDAAVRGAVPPLALDVVRLHGDMSLDEQQRAIRRGARRKLVLATNVAETALTIEGVTAVIDSGLARQARFDKRRGVNVLRVARVSGAAAEQRAGRAGRTAPGRCIRLWTRADHAARAQRDPPEIVRLDLSAMLLELRAWGQTRTLHWLDAPDDAALAHATRTLECLGAIDPANGSLTPVGRRMMAHGVAPRLARLLIEAEDRGCAAPGALLAALASERDICAAQRVFGRAMPTAASSGTSDLLRRLELFEAAARHGFARGTCAALGLDVAAVHAVERARRHLLRRLRPTGAATVPDDDVLLRCILAGFADRVVRRREARSDRGRMVGSGGVIIERDSVVRDAELLVAVDVQGAERPPARVRLASAIRREWLAEMYPGALRVECELVFDAAAERVLQRRRECFHDLVLQERTSAEIADRAAASELLAIAARHHPEHAAGLDRDADAFIERVRFLAGAMPEVGLPADTDAWVGDTVAQLCAGRFSFAELRRADALGALRAALGSVPARTLDREAPAEYRLPNGRAAAVRYARGKPPTVAARIQELFGLRTTPRVAGGRVSLVIEILAPNRRPVQITDDLASFWRTTYPEVRKQLRGRYPKHAWPEDPLAVAADGRARPRLT